MARKSTLGESLTHLKFGFPKLHIDRGFDLSQPRRISYQKLVEGIVKDPLFVQFVGNQAALFLVLGTSSIYLSNTKFSLTLRLVWNQLSLNDEVFKWGLVDLPDCQRCDLDLEETASYTFYNCPWAHLLWDYTSICV